MMDRVDRELLEAVIRCPACRGRLRSEDAQWHCDSCGDSYEVRESGAADFRLQREISRPIELAVGGEQAPKEAIDLTELRDNPNPAVNLSKFTPPKHLNSELLSWFPAASSDTSLALDIGCGEGQNRRVVEAAGFHYLGVDFCDETADILGDAQALPFADNSFEFALSIAVAEHVPYPQLKMRELFRVLQPGGMLIGTVSFLEPFHGSFFPHTHWGVTHSLTSAGFDVEHVGPLASYGVLTAQSAMGLFPGMPRALSRTVLAPVAWMHRFWYAVGRALRDPGVFSENRRKLITAGSLSFIARKPE